MGKIQTEVVSLVQAALKAGSSYRTSGTDGTFHKLLKEQNQTSGGKAKDESVSGNNSRKKAMTADDGKEAEPVKESGRTDKANDPGEAEEAENEEMVPSELLLQFQEAAGQLVAALAEQVAEAKEPPGESLETVAQPEISGTVVISEAVGEGVAQPETQVELPEPQPMPEKEVVKGAAPEIPEVRMATEEDVALKAEKVFAEKPGQSKAEPEAQPAKHRDGEEYLKSDVVQETESVRKAEAPGRPSREMEEETGQGTRFMGAVQQQPREYTVHSQVQTVSEPVRTSEPTIVSDVGRAIAQRLPGNDGTLTIELEPASLGKLTIHVLYESGKATVSILATNPRTLELLNTRATELASILEERTGQETVVYTEQPDGEQPFDERQGEGQQREQRQEEREHKEQSEQDSFLQQLRLGFL